MGCSLRGWGSGFTELVARALIPGGGGGHHVIRGYLGGSQLFLYVFVSFFYLGALWVLSPEYRAETPQIFDEPLHSLSQAKWRHSNGLPLLVALSPGYSENFSDNVGVLITTGPIAAGSENFDPTRRRVGGCSGSWSGRVRFSVRL